jgi:hypothetical protein
MQDLFCAFCASLWLNSLWLYYSRQGGRSHGRHFEVYDHLSLLRGNNDD